MNNSSACSEIGPDLPGSDFPPYYVTLMKLNSFFITMLNTLVLVCLSVKRKMFTGNYWAQVVCLSSSDILSGIGIWIMTTIEYRYVKTSLSLCSVAHLINIIAQIATLMNVFWICLRRFWGMRKMELPDKSRNVVDVFIQMVVVWLLSTAFCIVPFVLWSRKGCDLQGCSFSTLFGKSYYKAVGFLFSGLFLPLILTNIIYLTLMLKLRKLLQQVRPLIEHQVSNTRTANTRDNSKIVSNTSKQLEQRATIRGTETLIKTGLEHVDDPVWSLTPGVSDQTTSSTCSKTDSAIGEKENSLILPNPRNPTRYSPNSPVCINTISGISDQQREKQQHLTAHLAHKMPSTNSHGLRISETQETSESTRKPQIDTPPSVFVTENQQIQKNYKHHRSTHRSTTVFEVRLRKQRRSMLIIGSILTLLNLFTWPSAIISALSMSPTLHITYEHKVVILGIITMNSLINPFVYSIRIPEFRKAVKELYFDCYHFFVSLCAR